MIARRDALLVVAGALLFGLAYPPFKLLLPTFLALVPAIWLVRNAEDAGSAWQAWKTGFWFGTAMNALTLYWMVIALWRFTSLSALAYLATVLALGVFVGTFFWMVVRVRQAWPALPLVVVFPVLWTAGEWTVGHLSDLAFPWLGLGTSLAAYPVLAQTAEWWGARGLTLLVVVVNVGLATALDRRTPRRRQYRAVLAVAAGIVLAVVVGALRARAIPVRTAGTVALLQPDVGWSEKWEDSLREAIIDDLLQLTERAIREGRPDLVLWPEAAAPGPLYQGYDWGRRVNALAAASHTPILASGLDYIFRDDGGYDYYNAAFFVDSTGGHRGATPYRKRYLVPIVERVPFLNPEWFRGMDWFGGFGRGRELPLYETAIGRFGVMICYESAFESLSRRYRARGADFLVNVTNDAWYGRTAATYQHASHLVLRAIENRAGIARAANSGISGFVDPRGHYYATTELETRDLVVDSLVTSDVVPLYVRWGDWVGLLCMGMAVVMVGGVVVVGRWGKGEGNREKGVMRGRTEEGRGP